MWTQYASIKKDALDALLFYRMGDFYELFFDDAVEAAGILGITLTARNKGEGNTPIPMCGVPFHSAQGHINKLLKFGKRVAICEQTSDPTATKGIVKREIVRIVSPGMAFDPDALEANTNHYLLALHPDLAAGSGAYCLVELSTGSIEYAEYANLEQLRDDLSFLQPREVLISAEHDETQPWNELVRQVGDELFPCITPVPAYYFHAGQARQELCRHFNVLNLEGFGLDDTAAALPAVGAAYRRIRDTQKQGDLSHLAGPRDVQALQLILARLPALKASLKEMARSPLLTEMEGRINAFEELHQYLASRLKDEVPAVSREGNIFRTGWHTDLDELIALTEDGRQLLTAMEERERAATGINSLKIKYNKVFGYFIEITNSNLANVPPHYIRKQTTANGERFLTDELKKFEEKALSAEEKRLALEEHLFRQMVDRVATESQPILATASQLALLDALGSFAQAALEFGYVAPEITDQTGLAIEGGRHPALEQLVGRDKFIANSVAFTAKERIFLITGPNMAGKSTYMRQVALITLLAHAGSFVPATSAQIGLVDRIATRVGASDRIGRGQSTFMVEMNEMARILRQSTARSLLIIDEIGRGTSTYDGLALAWSILEDLADRLACRTLFATHYHELTGLESRYSSVRNLCVAVEERDGAVVFLHEVRRGKAPGSYGVEVARLAGLPAPVVARAKTILESLEKVSGGKSQKAQKEVLAQDRQLGLFGGNHAPSPPIKVPEHLNRLEQDLRTFDLDASSPLQALLAIKAWKDGLPAPSRSC
jgi:DNA mismatch repair ATPase MutS